MPRGISNGSRHARRALQSGALISTMDCVIKDALSRELTRTLRVRVALANEHGEEHPVVEAAQREYDAALLMLVEHVIAHRCLR